MSNSRLNKNGITENREIAPGVFVLSLKRQYDFFPGQNYFRCSSTMNKQGYFKGRLSSFLLNTDNLPVDYRYYICGGAEMVVEARDILISRGIPYNMIESEIYF